MTSTGEVTIDVALNKKDGSDESMGAGFFEAGGYIVTAYRIFLNSMLVSNNNLLGNYEFFLPKIVLFQKEQPLCFCKMKIDRDFKFHR